MLDLVVSLIRIQQAAAGMYRGNATPESSFQASVKNANFLMFLTISRSTRQKMGK